MNATRAETRWAARHLASLLSVAAPPALASAWILLGADRSRAWEALAAALAVSAGIAWSVSSRLRKRLRTISAVLAAYREGDFAIRARSSGDDALLFDVLTELNQLGDVLRSHRLGEMEAWTLLRKVMAEVDVVVMAIGDDGRIRLANDAASRVLGRKQRELVGAPASSFGLAELLEGAVPRTVKLSPDARDARAWELRRGSFRLEGVEQSLLVLSDVSHALRDNEREVWRRLIRVMGHEINNSLSPITSISESLLSLADPSNRGPDWESDLRSGLEIVARRAEGLGRFLGSYAALAKLPPPKFGPVHVPTLVAKVAALETRARVEVLGGPDVTVSADADQLEQALINLVKNATEASSSRQRSTVRLGWAIEGDVLDLAIEDDGPGVLDTANLFVPFFTTKPDGSGIGLVLSRQIVEAHDGQLTLTSSRDREGATAHVRLPMTTGRRRTAAPSPSSRALPE